MLYKLKENRVRHDKLAPVLEESPDQLVVSALRVDWKLFRFSLNDPAGLS